MIFLHLYNTKKVEITEFFWICRLINPPGGPTLSFLYKYRTKVIKVSVHNMLGISLCIQRIEGIPYKVDQGEFIISPVSLIGKTIKVYIKNREPICVTI